MPIKRSVEVGARSGVARDRPFFPASSPLRRREVALNGAPDDGRKCPKCEHRHLPMRVCHPPSLPALRKIINEARR